MASTTSNQTVVGAGSRLASRGPCSIAPAEGPACPERYTETQAVLHSMFMENVGGHILDSGDSYGRVQDAHRGRADPLAEPVVIFERDGSDTAATRSTFHALDAALKYSGELDERFARFCSRADAKDGSARSVFDMASEFAGLQDKAFSLEGSVHNTYNYPNPLDFSFEWFEFDARMSDGQWRRAALVMLHKGCDIRGGYGSPRAFVFRRGMSLGRITREFDAACKCTQVECWGQGVVYNADAASECEACAYRSDEDVDAGKSGAVGSHACICGEWPEHWKLAGDSNGSLLCKQCGAGVEVS